MSSLKTLAFRAQPMAPRLAEAAKPGATERINGRAGMRLRKHVYEEHQYLCVRCNAAGRVRMARNIDHRVPLEEGGSNDPSNLDPLCLECHAEKTATEASARARRQPWSQEATDRRLPTDLPRSRIPLTIVCGPPGGGKSTYVRERMGANDVLIDLDAIQQGMSGQPEHATGGQWVAPALDERNRMLRALAQDTEHDRAWFVIASPSPVERTTWASMLGAAVVIMDTPLDECIRRIEADPARVGHTERMIANARAWWALNGHLRAELSIP